MAKTINTKYLKGLTYRYSERKEVMKDGRKATEYAPKEREMKPEDVLSYKEEGNSVVLVTGDGRKLTVKKEK